MDQRDVVVAVRGHQMPESQNIHHLNCSSKICSLLRKGIKVNHPVGTHLLKIRQLRVKITVELLHLGRPKAVVNLSILGLFIVES